MSPERFRFVDHTGDLAVRLWGDDPADLLRSGGIALFHLIAPAAPVRPLRDVAVEARGADLEELLVCWMNRLLLAHELEQMLFCGFDVPAPGGGRVQGRARGEPVDPRRHGELREVKAVTYHDVAIERDGQRWTARVVLDV